LSKLKKNKIKRKNVELKKITKTWEKEKEYMDWRIRKKELDKKNMIRDYEICNDSSIQNTLANEELEEITLFW